jgi:hypothetical protein
METITHDATPGARWSCTTIVGDWNGWAIPAWSDGETAAIVLDDILGDDGRALYDSEHDVIMVDYWADDTRDDITRGTDGLFTVHGWTFEDCMER